MSETSSNWPRDELVFVDELRRHGEPRSKDGSQAEEVDDTVSAAVSLVVGGARQGVVALCASVAHIMRERKRLQQRVAELEEQVTSLENSSSATISVTDCSTSQSQTTDTRSLHESPLSQRCGSAPPAFITSALKYAKNDNQNIVGSCSVDSSRCTEESKLGGIHQRGTGESRTSSVSMPETNSNFIRKNHFETSERKEAFHRGQSYASTRSLNIGGHLSSGNFVRRKYSTISLRRVRRRSTASKKAAGAAWSSNSINGSSSNLDQQNHGKSCIVTVAEIHREPPIQQCNNTENDAVKLLARTLTSVLQEQDTMYPESQNETFVATTPVTDPSASQSQDFGELCAPHPLTGCECLVCMHLSSDPDCHLYALTTEEGALLPPGSRVLVRGDHVGTVLYLGHDKYPTKQMKSYFWPSQDPSENSKRQVISEESMETSIDIADDDVPPCVPVRPVGVTIRLWPPDAGQMFVPLSAVICQLDDDQDTVLNEMHDQEYEYMDEGSEDSTPSRTSITYEYPTEFPSLTSPSVHASTEESRPPALTFRGSNKSKDSCETPVRKVSLEGYFIRSPSISSCSSDSTRSLGDLSVYGLEYQEDGVSFEEGATPENSTQKGFLRQRNSCSSTVLSQTPCDPGIGSQENSSSGTSSLNATFIYRPVDEEGSCGPKDSGECASLYDTADSAISLTFMKRYKESLGSTEPSSMSDTDRDSPHFGDTWDSGCSVGRGRCKSDSSGQFSDVDSESSRFGSPWVKNLRDALDSVWARQQNSNYNRNYDSRNKSEPSRRKGKKTCGNHLDFFRNNRITKIYIDHGTTEHSQV